MEVIFWNSL